ncbi:MAG TPA: tetratricopeptide repeat protein [Kofleriaceae bacterium]|nr:tetratricopeptide repeat protein [Kofleriaceae bacterium]
MRSGRPVWVAVILLAATAGSARADLASAREKFVRGDYKGAEADLLKVTGKQAEDARVELARVHLRTGRYVESEKIARALSRSRDAGAAAAARLVLAEVLRTTGRLKEARLELEPIVAQQPDRLRARYLLGLVYHDLGDTRERKVWEGIDGELDPGKVDHETADPESIFYYAEAQKYLAPLVDKDELFQHANESFQDATARAPALHDANIAWGYLFLEKYANGDAEQSFAEVLKMDAHHPDAHAGIAAAKLDPGYDLAAAMGHLEQALAINPRHVPSLLVRAGIEIDRNEWDKAKATIGEVLAVNPNSLDGHALLATVHWLRDDVNAYQAEKKLVLAANPRHGRFFHLVARSAVREHRYTEAIDLEREAVAAQPTHYEAMEAIGTGYLRLGMEKEGLEWLRKAWKGDNFNLRTKNTLDLFEDWIPKEYSFATSKSFKVRYHNDEKPIFRRYVEPLLEDAYASMTKRYGFAPRTPVVVELFQNAEAYSVRTVGLPNLSALGVCFGQVITAMSPSVGDINWAMVLWHELGHVFAIQLSSSRVPRWFTEGLSEYETVLARPEWRRENDADVYAAMVDGSLPKIAELNYGFMKPNMQEVVVAYHTASLAVEFLARTYGFPKIVDALKLYGKGLETPAVLEKITGKKMAALDAEFRKHLEVRLAPYAGTFQLPLAGMDDVAPLKKAAAAKPKDAAAQARLALGHFYEGEAAPAQAAAERALALDPQQTWALYVAAELALRQGDHDAARGLYERMIQAGADSFDVRARLGTIAAGAKDDELAIKHFCTAKKLDPERAMPYQALAELYRRAGRTEDALRELESYVMIEQMQLGPAKELVEGYAALKKWDKVRAFGELATEISLADADLFVMLGQAYLETGSPDRALFSFDSALLVRPEMRRPGMAHLGRARALLALGDRKGALKAVDQALRFESDNADAAALRKQLRGK